MNPLNKAALVVITKPPGAVGWIGFLVSDQFWPVFNRGKLIKTDNWALDRAGFNDLHTMRLPALYGWLYNCGLTKELKVK